MVFIRGWMVAKRENGGAVRAGGGTRYTDLGPSYHERHLDKTKRPATHFRQFEALGYTVTQAA